MNTVVVIVAAGLVAAAAVGAQPSTPSADPLPPGHPPVNTMPPGHPPVTTMPPGHPPVGEGPATQPANLGDVSSARGIVDAYYDSISGPPGAPREWERFRSLFLPEARLVTVISGRAGDTPLALAPEQFVGLNRKYFEGSGYVERQIRVSVDAFGRIAHALSTYEARRGGDAAAYSRGVNSFQLLQSHGRWWIVNVLWDRERPGVTVPERYLPPGPVESP